MNVDAEDLRQRNALRYRLGARSRTHRSHADFAMLVFVLLMALLTALWVGPHVAVSLSGLAELPAESGFLRVGSAPRHFVGYAPDSNPDSSTEMPVFSE